MTKLKQFIKTEYNIIQAPMAGNILTPEFVAKVCNSGMLGCIPGGYLDMPSLKNFIIKTKELTKVSFCLNLFIEDERKEVIQVKKSEKILKLEKDLGMSVNVMTTAPKTILHEEYVELIIKECIPVVSFTFGFFNKKLTEKLKSNGIKIIGTVTSIDEFKYCVDHGFDAVVVQGAEAGGHQGSFLSQDKNNIKTLEFLNAVRKLNKNLILIAAGGISSKNMAEYFNSGADYVQLGTAFMMTFESNLLMEAKEFIIKNATTEITKNITGRWARGTVNKLMEELNNDKIYNFPLQHFATLDLRAFAKKTLNPEYLSLWAGSNSDNFKLQNLSDLIEELKISYNSVFNIDQ